jgi:hypothetical protein
MKMGGTMGNQEKRWENDEHVGHVGFTWWV